jgi:hypothetical protein
MIVKRLDCGLLRLRIKKAISGRGTWLERIKGE